jgi:hypothetical protein
LIVWREIKEENGFFFYGMKRKRRDIRGDMSGTRKTSSSSSDRPERGTSSSRSLRQQLSCPLLEKLCGESGGMVRLKYRYIIGQVLIDPSWKEHSSMPSVSSSDLQIMIRVRFRSLLRVRLIIHLSLAG